MQNLVEMLDENIVMEEDNRPWGSLVVLAVKPHQENMPCHEYQWKLCVSYQKLNHITRPFTFPILFCDDAVQDIEKEAKCFIAVDMDSGYWKVVAEEEVRKRLAFFTPDGNWRQKMMPMGSLNVDPTFVVMMMKL